MTHSSGFDLAALCNIALATASNATSVSDQLHIELAASRVKSFWPDATGWSMEYVPYDDMPGGDWYLDGVVTDGDPYDYKTWYDRSVLDWNNDADHEAWKEEIDNILCVLWEPSEAGTIRALYFD